jgi:hypothetical protein
MAFKPSARSGGRSAESQEPDMLSFMCLMCILIPMLLASAEFCKVGMIELNLPKAAGGGGGGGPTNEPKEQDLKLNVNVTITKDGFYVGSALGVATMSGEPTIAKTGKDYDFPKLTKYLWDLKKKAEGKFSDLENISLVAENDIQYIHIIHAMDATRTHKDETDGKTHVLFPNISIAAGIM